MPKGDTNHESVKWCDLGIDDGGALKGRKGAGVCY